MKRLILILKKTRRYYRFLKSRKKLKKRILKNKGSVQIIIGSGRTNYDGWIATDLPFFNILNKASWQYYFIKCRPNKLVAEHVFEHLSIEENKRALYLSFEFLESEGVLRIAVPDKNNENTDYINAVKPGGWDTGADDHKSFWNFTSLKQIAENIGFNVVGLEYYNDDYLFQIAEYNDDNGYIKRSRKNKYIDQNVPNYSSLIVDLIKP